MHKANFEKQPKMWLF